MTNVKKKLYILPRIEDIGDVISVFLTNKMFDKINGFKSLKIDLENEIRKRCLVYRKVELYFCGSEFCLKGMVYNPNKKDEKIGFQIKI